jgi:Zn-dependent protease with chaperone function
MVTWASLAALSVILSYLITFVLGLASLLFGLQLLLGMLKGGLSPIAVLLAAFTLMMGGTVFWSLLPRKIPFETNGVPIDLSRETRLRAEVEALAKALNEKMPTAVYFVPVANAAVLERGPNRIMLLGLPLMQLLTVSQFRAILAHEFGHFYAGDTRMGPWVFRARMNMAQVIRRLGKDSTMLSFLSRWVVVAVLRLAILGGLSLWWKLFNRVTQHVSRKQEYVAMNWPAISPDPRVWKKVSVRSAGPPRPSLRIGIKSSDP